MLIDGVHHVSLNVSDTDRALTFYCDGLGMRPIERPDFSFGGAWLDAGAGNQVHLIEADVPPDQGQHVAFRVGDLDAVVAALRDRGVEVSNPKLVADTAIRQAFLHDPDGNRLELNQPA